MNPLNPPDSLLFSIAGATIRYTQTASQFGPFFRVSPCCRGDIRWSQDDGFQALCWECREEVPWPRERPTSFRTLAHVQATRLFSEGDQSSGRFRLARELAGVEWLAATLPPLVGDWEAVVLSREFGPKLADIWEIGEVAHRWWERMASYLEAEGMVEVGIRV